MSMKKIAAVLAISAACAGAYAGGEIQEYGTPYSAYSGGGYGAYQAPMPANYARPASVYYGGYGCSPCATMPYGYAYGGAPRTGFGNDVLTAGLIGIGVGYLLFH